MRICVECHHSNPDTHTQCQACGGALILPEGIVLQGRLRRYRVDRVLGVGGFGVTYLTTEVPTGRLVVVKELQARHIHDPKVKELFEREAQALAVLDPAQGVPDIFDFFYSQDRRAYLVMEYVEGETLAALATRQGALSKDEVVDIGLKVLQVLTYLHRQGVIHRDVKPGNIMLRPDGSVALIDFGAVKQAVSARVTTGGHVTSTMIATPGYAPPEQTRGLSVDQTADLFGLGATLIHLLTGIHPIDLVNAKTGDFEWRDRVQVEEGLARVIERVTAYRPVDRYQSADEMSRDLAVAERIPAWPEEVIPPVVREPRPPFPSTPLPPAPVPIPTPAPPPAQQRVPVWIWALGVLAVLALVMGIVTALRGGEKQPAVVVEVEVTATSTSVVEEATSTPRSTATATATPTRQPTPTPTAMPTPRPTSTPLPGVVVVPLEDLAHEIPWLSPDEITRPGVFTCGFNVNKPPFDNRLVRRAFAAAVDRRVIADLASTLGAENARPATTLISPEVLGRDLYGHIGLPFDPAEAQALLAEAGYPNGQGFPAVTLATNKGGSSFYIPIVNAIVAMWREHLQVNVEIEVFDDAQTYFDLLARDVPAIYRVSWLAEVDEYDPDAFLRKVFHSRSEDNWDFFSNAEFDYLVERAAALRNPATRQALYIHGERILCEDEAAVIPMFHYTWTP